MKISNIDDLLNGEKSNTKPETPENQYEEPEEIEEEEKEPLDPDPESEESEETSEETRDDDEDLEEEEPESDEYGNEKPKKRTYTEEEHKELVNKAIRERFERFQRNNPQAQEPTPQQVNKAAEGFTYDENSKQDWQQQLESFVENTVGRMATKQQEAVRQQQEQQLQADFEHRFGTGMQKFKDFRDVITGLPAPITDAMTISLRALDDPASFIYAAAKRHPQELERISKMRDPYAQMTEMGRLEERMRKNKPTTKSPRPIERTKEDLGMKEPKKKSKEPTIEDLIAKSDAKRMAQIRARRGR